MPNISLTFVQLEKLKQLRHKIISFMSTSGEIALIRHRLFHAKPLPVLLTLKDNSTQFSKTEDEKQRKQDSFEEKIQAIKSKTGNKTKENLKQSYRKISALLRGHDAYFEDPSDIDNKKFDAHAIDNKGTELTIDLNTTMSALQNFLPDSNTLPSPGRISLLAKSSPEGVTDIAIDKDALEQAMKSAETTMIAITQLNASWISLLLETLETARSLQKDLPKKAPGTDKTKVFMRQLKLLEEKNTLCVEAIGEVLEDRANLVTSFSMETIDIRATVEAMRTEGSLKSQAETTTTSTAKRRSVRIDSQRLSEMKAEHQKQPGKLEQALSKLADEQETSTKKALAAIRAELGECITKQASSNSPDQIATACIEATLEALETAEATGDRLEETIAYAETIWGQMMLDASQASESSPENFTTITEEQTFEGGAAASNRSADSPTMATDDEAEVTAPEQPSPVVAESPKSPITETEVKAEQKTKTEAETKPESKKEEAESPLAKAPAHAKASTFAAAAQKNPLAAAVNSELAKKLAARAANTADVSTDSEQAQSDRARSSSPS